MATFEEVKTHLEKLYKISVPGSEKIEIEVPLPGNRTQKVSVEKTTEHKGLDYLRLVSFVAPAKKIDPKSCLRFNVNFLGAHLGMLKHEGEDMIVMCDTQFLKTMDMEELEVSVNKVVKAADGLEAKLFSQDVY